MICPWQTSPQPLHREDSALHEEPHKQKHHKIGFSRVMFAAVIAQRGRPSPFFYANYINSVAFWKLH